jgi:hypothetical protein
MGLAKFLFSGNGIVKDTIGNNACTNTEEQENILDSKAGKEVP